MTSSPKLLGVMEMKMTGWIQQCRTAPVHDVLLQAGLKQKGRQAYGPCPVCGAEARSSTDQRRGPIFVGRQTGGWLCFACKEKGDVVNLVSMSMFAAKLKDLEREKQLKVREWFSQRAFCESQDRDNNYQARPTMDVAPPSYPPQDEVQALWDACLPLSTPLAVPGGLDANVLSFFETRKWFPTAVANADVARLTPARDQYAWPDWWPQSRANGWRLVVPAYNHKGEMVSLHARAVRDVGEYPKTLWPKGFDATDLIMADAQGLKLLRKQSKPTKVIICEGLTDLVATTLAKKTIDNNVAVLSCANGGFSALAKVSWPKWVPIYCSTDDDKIGRLYAAQIATAISPTPVRITPLSKVGC